jgi:hypothetical protein
MYAPPLLPQHTLTITTTQVRLGGSVVAHLLLSGDRKWKKTAVTDPDDAVRQPDADPMRTKRVIFIRHGESDWNEVRVVVRWHAEADGEEGGYVLGVKDTMTWMRLPGC